ncbi:transferrin-binding protein-like solute binding protein [Mannheimia varigena]|uniref:transferrin-binding protein-like solute binding protein n=1 Tax=Mannheimia varigena TaxID=85404 RepID=UPI0015B41148|nr:transferrin-binding protein-like solute binding protein [Mannheimia varigena]QLD32471.1 hypothetical protein A6B42_01220 [Mannheimia varigena]
MGKFYYHYTDAPVQNLEGRVSAHYNHNDKKIGIELFGQNQEYWEVKDNVKVKTVDVKEDGSIFGKLWSKTNGFGSFEGGIYGKNAEILAGKVEYTDETPRGKNESWIGVVGAKAKVE